MPRARMGPANLRRIISPTNHVKAVVVLDLLQAIRPEPVRGDLLRRLQPLVLLPLRVLAYLRLVPPVKTLVEARVLQALLGPSHHADEAVRPVDVRHV